MTWQILFLAVMAIFWLYVTARMVTRAVLRSIEEKEKERAKKETRFP